jgi:hypothetical protein
MTIEEISNEQFIEISLKELNTEPIYMLRDLVHPPSAKIYYYGLKSKIVLGGFQMPSSIPMYRFRGEEFNLNAKEGDFCRIIVRYHGEIERFVINGYFMWEGIVTKEILEYSGCRIGQNYRGVLFEKTYKKKPQAF